MSVKENTQQKAGHQVKVTLTRSLLGRPEKHRRIAAALGLKRTQRSVLHYQSPTISGMLKKISHLLTVEEVS